MNKKIKVLSAVLVAMILSSQGISYGQEKLIDRVSGGDRYQTSIDSLRYFEKSDTIILASGKNLIDSVTASSLSSILKAPIILVGDELKPEVFREISPQNILIVGGYDSVKKSIEDDLKIKYRVERISGDDRYQTSKKIGDYARRKFDIKSMVITSGKNITDSLIASFLVSKERSINILVDKENNMNEVKKLSNVLKTYIVGGENSVDKDVERNTNATRISGKDRYQTAKAVYDKYKKDSNGLIVVNSKKIPDSVVAASLSGRLNMGIMFSDDKNIIESVKKGVKTVIIGGEESVEKNIYKDIENIVYGQKNIDTSNPFEYSGVFVDPNSLKVDVPDKNLKKLLNFYIDKKRSSDHYITVGDMKKLKYIDVSQIDGLPHSVEERDSLYKKNKNKYILKIDNVKISSKKLEDIRVTRGIKSIKGLEFATNLEYLDLSENEITDISPIKNLKKLEMLEIDRNIIEDISPLKDLTNLKHLNLYSNYIKDISPLKNLVNLEFLDLHYNLDDDRINGGVVDISPLKNMNKLYKLDLSDNNVEDISSLPSLENMKQLMINGNHVKDISYVNDFCVDAMKSISVGGDKSANVSQGVNIDDVVITGNSAKVEFPVKGYIDFCQRYMEAILGSYDPSIMIIMPNGVDSDKINVSLDSDGKLEFRAESLVPGEYNLGDISITADYANTVTIKNVKVIVK